MIAEEFTDSGAKVLRAAGFFTADRKSENGKRIWHFNSEVKMELAFAPIGERLLRTLNGRAGQRRLR
jgi:hypothetical protein